MKGIVKEVAAVGRRDAARPMAPGPLEQSRAKRGRQPSGGKERVADGDGGKGWGWWRGMGMAEG